MEQVDIIYSGVDVIEIVGGEKVRPGDTFTCAADLGKMMCERWPAIFKMATKIHRTKSEK